MEPEHTRFNDIDRCPSKQRSLSQQNMTIHPILNHIIYTASYISSPSSDLSTNSLSLCGTRHGVIALRRISLLFKNNSPMPCPPTSIRPKTKQPIYEQVNNGYEQWCGN
jgi:hypothetical protein